MRFASSTRRPRFLGARGAPRGHSGGDHRPLRPAGRSRAARGFSLLELLLSLALISMLLLALNTFVFSMGEIWGRNTDQRLFDQHVRAVTRYVDGLLRSAVIVPYKSGTGSGNPAAGARAPAGGPPTTPNPPAATSPAATTAGPIVPQEVRGGIGAATETLLTFVLPAGARVLPWPASPTGASRPLPDVECSLAAREGQGLMLYWHSRLETKFHDDPPRTAVLTPLVSALSYDYYNADFKTWQNQALLQKDNQGQWQLPTRLRLKFQYGTYTAETVITLPTVAQGLPFY
jgi:prepilin-type N-terminal cleavage/methylation domain-containing protein